MSVIVSYLSNIIENYTQADNNMNSCVLFIRITNSYKFRATTERMDFNAFKTIVYRKRVSELTITTIYKKNNIRQVETGTICSAEHI